VLTILGVIMFLRFGFVTGHVGLEGTIAIVLIANVVSVLTSLSLAAIATNTRVKGGGDYYLISRSLGLEFGGAIGTVLYVAQSVSVGFYIVGFTEALMTVTGPLSIPGSILGMAVPPEISGLDPTTVGQLISTAVCLSLFAVAYKGADVATKLQYVIMTALTLALLSFFYGASQAWNPELMESNLGPAPAGIANPEGGLFEILPFWAVFAIFFPAVTGFTQGVSMSGDLKDPAKSLPRGTFMAVGVSLLIYLILPFIFVNTVSRAELLVPGAESMKGVSTFGWLIDAGVYAATLSSALASFMGAPRILRAMSLDHLFPGSGFFAQADKPNAEPRRAISLTLVIALACIWGGDLNVLAGVVTMFFLLSYGAMNYATFVEGFSRNPSFRPRFKLAGWRTSLAGAIVCAAVMFAIDPLATVVSLLVLGGIHQFLVRRDLDNPAGDARRGFYVQRIKDYLIKLGERPAHPRNWRPVVIAVTRPGEDGRPIARFAQAVGSAQGILTMAVVLRGRFHELIDERRKQLDMLERFVQTGEQRFFYQVSIADTYAHGIRSLLQTHGIGHLRPNTLMLYWSSGLEAEYLEVLVDATALDYNVVLLHPQQSSSPFSTDASTIVEGRERHIDIWWRGRANGSLSLLLAHLIRETREWRGCKIRLLRIVRGVDDMEGSEREMVELVESSRIEAKVTIVHSKGAPFDVIAEESRDAHLVFLGVGGISNGGRADLARYNDVLDRLGTTVLVRASQALDVEV
jgi:amino acid transporter